MFQDLIAFTESDNIAEDLDEERLKKIGSLVVEGFDKDLQSRAEWEKRNKDAMKLALQTMETKNYPWTNASNIKFPLLAEAALQFNSRMYPELVNGDQLVTGKVVGEDNSSEKVKTAERISQHMSYQLLEQMDEWEEDQDKLLITLPILGCMFKKKYYDPIIKRNRSDLIYPKDFVVDYFAKNIKDASRKSHVLNLNKNEIQKNKVNGLYLELDLGDPEIIQKEDEGESLNGQEGYYDEDVSTYKFIEQHRYLDLDEDGLAEPYICTVEHSSQRVFRIIACYEPEDIASDAESNVLDVVQTPYFTKYGFVPNPDGSFYDIGFGQIMGPLNHAIDTNINQLIDAGHFSTLQGGFLGRGFRGKKGNWKFSPGEWKQTDAMGDDLKKSILPLPVREPSNVLFSLLSLMINQGQRIGSTMDSQVGENPGQNQKATTTMAVLEQGSKIFSSIYKRCHRALKDELEGLFRLNSIYLETEEYFNILDSDIPEESWQAIKRADYNTKTFNVIPTADRSYNSKQLKMAKAQGLAELIPLGTVNPVIATKRMLEAQEQSNIKEIMELPEPQPSIEELEFKLKQLESQDKSNLEWTKVELETLKIQQSDLTTRTNAILALAKAEGEEVGPQLDQYKTELKTLVDLSKQVGDRVRAKEQELKKASTEAQ